MENDEVYQLLFLGFGLGIIGLEYFPGVVSAVVPFIALLGAFYLVFGVIARMGAFATGIGWSRKEDWMNGIALLVLVGFLLGYPQLAINSVKLMLGLFTGVIKWIVNLA